MTQERSPQTMPPFRARERDMSTPNRASDKRAAARTGGRGARAARICER